MRAQGSLEYLIIIAAILAIAAIVILFLTGAFGGSKTAADISLCKESAARCASEWATSISPTCPYCDIDCPAGLVDICKAGQPDNVVTAQCVEDIDCDDGDICTEDTCDGQFCNYAAANEGNECDDDGDICTQHTCTSGTCTMGPANEGDECDDDGDMCTQHICTTGTCTMSSANEGNECDDDSNDCTEDVCTAGTCTENILPDGTPCGVGGQCISGACDTCTDSDSDGYYAIDPNCPGSDDCDDTDAAVNPGAAEVCCNSIDDNCDGTVDEGCACFIRLDSIKYSTALRVFADGDYAYLGYKPGTGSSRLKIIDVTDKSNILGRGTYFPQSEISALFVSNDYLYITTSEGLEIVDVSDKWSPALVKHYTDYIFTGNVFVLGDYAYMSKGVDGFAILDVSDKLNPVEVGSSSASAASSISVVGDLAYVAGGSDGLVIFDVFDKSSPDELGRSDAFGGARSVSVVGDYAYIAGTVNDLAICDVSDKNNPEFIGSYNDADRGIKVFATEDYVIVSDRLATSMIARIVNVTDKTNPQYLTKWCCWSVDFFAEWPYAYTASGGSGIIVAEITTP